MVKIPFRWLPASWGLKGKAFELAEAHYLHEGEALDRRIAEIEYSGSELEEKRVLLDVKYGVRTPFEGDVAIAAIRGEDTPQHLARLEHQHGLLDAYHYEVRLATLNNQGTDLDLAVLEVQHKHGKIDKRSYEKAVANIKQEPWIAIIDDGFDKDKGLDGVYFEFDWNDRWIEYLKMNGYVGRNEDEIIEKWFRDVCRAYILEEDSVEAFRFGTVTMK